MSWVFNQPYWRGYQLIHRGKIVGNIKPHAIYPKMFWACGDFFNLTRARDHEVKRYAAIDNFDSRAKRNAARRAERNRPRN